MRVLMPSVAFFALGLTACAEGVDVSSHPSARTLALENGGLLPDIVEEPPRHLNVQRAQKEEWLRFTSTHWNGGDGPLQVRGADTTQICTVEEHGATFEAECTVSTQEILDAAGNVVATNPAGVAVFHPDHNHWHQDNVADFMIRAGALDGPVVGQATKITYCLIDYDRDSNVPNNSTKVYYECNADLQGISVGFGDEYHHATHGQEIDITTLAPGIYYITHEADPTNKWLELRDDNNGSWTKFRLRRDAKSSQAHVDVLEESPCEGLASNPTFADIACGNTSNK